MKPAWRFTWESNWIHAPMAWWVHRPVDGQPGVFDPPVPPAVPHRGHAWLRVDCGGHEWVFSAPAQLDHAIEVLSRVPLPTSRALSAARGGGAGPNGHWLSRLPAAVKSPRERTRHVQALRAVRGALQAAGGGWPPREA